MQLLQLFPEEQIVGVFRGFSEGGLEFHADLVLPYRHEFQSIPMHGQFVLVQLETPDEAVLGRITSLSSAGKLSTGVGEEFNIRAVREGRPVPEDLREQYLKYQVDIRVLGVLRKDQRGKLTFVASHRRLPHVGSPVAFLSDDVLREVVGHNVDGVEIGHFAMGEYIYAQGSDRLEILDWMQIKAPEALVRFPIKSLVSRRSFIFARAGFGKSNLNKLLFSKLYEETPMVTKRGNRQVPVGTVLFDPEGEYFWPDDRGRPGLCDVPGLEDRLIVFTNRRAPSAFYQSFVAGGVKLDIRRLDPGDVISIAVSPEKQTQQNIRKLTGLNQPRWEELVDLIYEHGYQTPVEDIRRILDLQLNEEVQVFAARANMTVIVRMLHDPSSQLMDKLIRALSRGKLCVVDISQMRGAQARVLSGLILRRIFDRNQQEFTAADPQTIPTIAVVEEAQAVLNEGATGAAPYIAWVKEGRKYDLGAVLVTQQPGSIPVEILSQGDNWFIFHLLSAADLRNIQKANAHFSEDILSAILNEPIPGQGVFWSSSSGNPFPVAIRALSFERMYPPRDPYYDQPAVNTYARVLTDEFEDTLRQAGGIESAADHPESLSDEMTGEVLEEQEPIDQLRTLDRIALNAIQNDPSIMQSLQSESGVAWGTLKAKIMEALPETVEDRDQFAYRAVAKAMTVIFGPQDQAWETHRLDRNGRLVTYVRVKE